MYINQYRNIKIMDKIQPLMIKIFDKTIRDQIEKLRNTK